MAKSKRVAAKKHDSDYDRLARLIKSEGEDIRSDMKSEFGSVRSELHKFREETHNNFSELREEIGDIKARLESLEQKVGSMSGYSKEIDHLIARVAKIERRLGITTR